MNLVICGSEEINLSIYKWYNGYVTENGPLLPLIASRVLCWCSDTLLKEFRGEDSGIGLKASLWTDYSVGTRKIGSLLDSLLHKVYRCLHGFNLSTTADSKEGAHASPHESNCKAFVPESVRAAAQLYRCVMRSCAFGRKVPPKNALDTILAALPRFERSPRDQKLREFLFDANNTKLDLKGIVAVAQKSHAWETCFEGVSPCFETSWDQDPAFLDESSLVRHGIAHLISQGPLPQYQEAPEADARVETASVESELSRKFDAILFELGHGNIANCKNWVKAAQCCWTKAEIVADRLGKQRNFVQCRDFIVKGPIIHDAEGVSFADLVSKQEREDELRHVGWTEVVGQDLSVFMDHCWSSFASLKDCSRTLERQFKLAAETQEDIRDSLHSYEEITRLFRDKRYDLWQQCWGGIYVSSLRILSRRCMAVALFVSYKGLDNSIEPGDERLAAEICESLGTFMYSEVSGSQIYGYPMRKLTQHRKRKFSEAAAIFYNEALQLQRRSARKDKEGVPAEWDILFMVGKVSVSSISFALDRKF